MAREAAGESVVSGDAYDALALGSGRRGNRRAPSFGPGAPAQRCRRGGRPGSRQARSSHAHDVAFYGVPRHRAARERFNDLGLVAYQFDGHRREHPAQIAGQADRLRAAG